MNGGNYRWEGRKGFTQFACIELVKKLIVNGAKCRTETHTMRQASQHVCLPSLLGDGDKWIKIVYGDVFYTGPTRAAKARQKSLVLARQAKLTNQRRTPFICNFWVPIYHLQPAGATPVYSLSGAEVSKLCISVLEHLPFRDTIPLNILTALLTLTTGRLPRRTELASFFVGIKTQAANGSGFLTLDWNESNEWFCYRISLI